jgi:hypothetical protein
MEFDKMQIELQDRFQEIQSLNEFDCFVKKFLSNPTGQSEGKSMELQPVIFFIY